MSLITITGNLPFDLAFTLSFFFHTIGYFAAYVVIAFKRLMR